MMYIYVTALKHRTNRNGAQLERSRVHRVGMQVLHNLFGMSIRKTQIEECFWERPTAAVLRNIGDVAYRTHVTRGCTCL